MLVTATGAELKRKVSSFRIASLIDNCFVLFVFLFFVCLFFCFFCFFFVVVFFPVFHHKDAENLLPSFISDVP